MKKTFIRLFAVAMAVLLMLTGMLSASAYEEYFDYSAPYADVFMDWYYQRTEYEAGFGSPMYRYFYSHYGATYDESSTDEASTDEASTDEASTDERIPDFVLAHISSPFIGEVMTYGVFGDYIVGGGGCYEPYCLAYHIYIPSTGEILTLREAWNSELEGIEEAVSVIGYLIGDADGDGKLTVKDATHIQKVKAGLLRDRFEMFFLMREDGTEPDACHVFDFNRDRKVDVKDATAVQKCIAGIEYR